MAQQRQQGKRLKPAGCPIRVSGGDRLREASGKFQPCRDFPDENKNTLQGAAFAATTKILKI